MNETYSKVLLTIFFYHVWILLFYIFKRTLIKKTFNKSQSKNFFNDVIYNKKNIGVDAISRYVASLHGIMTFMGGLYTYLYFDKNIFVWWRYFQVIPLSFCLYEISFIHFGHNEMYRKGNSLLIHHLLFMFFIWCSTDYCEEVSQGYLMEISNPFLHLSYIIHKSGFFNEYLKISKIIWFIFLILFTLFRIVNLLLLIISSMGYGETSVIFSAVILFLMNLDWYIRALNKTIKLKTE